MPYLRGIQSFSMWAYLDSSQTHKQTYLFDGRFSTVPASGIHPEYYLNNK